MKSSLLISAAFVIIAASSCNTNNKDNHSEISNKKITKASWLLGKWQNNDTGSYSTESWEKQNDSTYTGRSYTIAGKDTVFSETFTLLETADSMFYMPSVKNQNNGQAIKFAMTSMTDNKLVFENPNHDYPQKITYNKINDDSLVAEISGVMQGKQTSQQFPMKKVK